MGRSAGWCGRPQAVEEADFVDAPAEEVLDDAAAAGFESEDDEADELESDDDFDSEDDEDDVDEELLDFVEERESVR
ncbi:hypothetical protein ACQEVZ_22200 [Dactylosporangium sp. CA-152071]|uniref:hypothetical protein n=1 Tax=Dactylosporangium sp. CA-152071 TaxID=3239933 RepID=UPI003D8E93F4